MKRKIFVLLLCLVLVLPVSVRAEAPLVIDSAELLSQQQEQSLEAAARSLQETYQMDVVILTVISLEGASARSYAEEYYDSNGYGDNGILFLLAMEERDWYISTCGTAITAVSDDDVDRIAEYVIPYLSDGDYDKAFDSFLDSLEPYFYVYQKSHDHQFSPEQVPGPDIPVSKRISWPTSILVGLIAAGGTVLFLVSSMNTKRRQNSAVDYLQPGSYHLRTQRDLFLYSSVRKVRRQQSSSSGGRRSSGGRSHGGRGGKF